MFKKEQLDPINKILKIKAISPNNPFSEIHF